jgi:hypothetical protein
MNRQNGKICASIVVPLALLILLLPGLAAAEQNQDNSLPGMASSQAPSMPMNANDARNMQPRNFLQAIIRHASSGTDSQPDSTPTPMWMTSKGSWTLMFHANVFVLDEQQSSTRGGDKFFSTNWFMPMAQRDWGPGVFTTRAMLSLEPATITDRRYPLLFQEGETAYGAPIVDGQHPHDFFMELAAMYDWKLGDKALLSIYLAPVGDPALGPVAYPHRASALENPVAALGHHQEDSTHISDDVVTAGITYGIVRVEASGFHGREPNEHRWEIQQGNIDSWSTRLTVQPGRNWSAQYSYGYITSIEALSPDENQERMTASVMYNLPFRNGNWASTVLWGRAKSLPDNAIFNSYLLESTVRFVTRNYVWTRIENVDRSNELLLGENSLPPDFVERPIGRVQAYTIGYDHDFDFIPRVATALGAQGTVYSDGPPLRAIYGAHPVGGAIFVRFRPYSGNER